MSYQHDTPETLYNELKELEAKIEDAGRQVHFSGQLAAQKKAVYEELKNKMLIEMHAEEAKSGTKRTIEQRQSIYRTTYAQQRLEATLAENEWKASGEYLRALLGNQSSLQTRNRILQADMHIARAA